MPSVSTVLTYKGDGSRTVFETPPFASASTVTVANVSTSFTVIDSTTISISPAPAVDAAIAITGIAFRKINGGATEFTGTRAQRLTLSGAVTGDEFHETDYSAIWQWTGSVWRELAPRRTATVDSDYRGVYPATYHTYGSATGAAAGVIYPSADVSMHNAHIIDLSALTATSVDVYGSVDGTNFSGPLRLTDLKTGALFATSALTAVGIYKLSGKFKKIRLDQVGAGGATVRYSHAWE